MGVFSSILRVLTLGTHLLDLTDTKPLPETANYLLIKRKLCASIKNRQTVRLRYANESFFLTFNPYVVYRSPKNKILVAGVQTQNDSRPDKKPSPATFEVAKIAEIKTTEEFFDYDIFWQIPENEFANGVICILKP